MRCFINTLVVFVSIIILPNISYTQKPDSTSGFATLYIFHPKEGATGAFNIHLGDSVIYKSKYNSRDEIKIYKEGKMELWVSPRNENTISIDVKFGERYFLKCLLIKDDKMFMPNIKLVDSILGNREYFEIINRDSLKAMKMLDTIQRRNTIYAELGGQALAYSINYDRLYRVNKKVKNSFSAGLEIIDFSWKYYSTILTPFSYNFLFGKKRDYLELGIGLTSLFNRHYNDPWEYYPYEPLHAYRTSIYLFTSPKIGWRFQPNRGGLFFRAAFSPVIHILSYDSPRKYKNATHYNEPAAYYFFEDWQDIPWSTGPVLPWAGISFGYTFNAKKKKD